MTDRTINQRSMDPLDFLTNEELLFFFHRKKTEISCIEQPRRLITQLRDHDLVPEKLFENVKKMRSRKQKEKGFYEVLDWLEINRPQYIHQFWRCVFEDHILQLYPTLRKLKNSLLDGTFKLCEKPPDVETLTVEESEGKPEKGKEKSYKRKTSKDDRSSEDSDGPDLFSAFTPNQKKPDKKPSFCTFKLCEKPPDVETLTVEESEGKPEKGKEKSYKRKTSKDDRSSEDSDGPDLFSAFTPNQKKPDKKPSFCTFKLCEKPPDVETLTVEESEGKPEKGKEKSYKRKTSKDDRSSEDSDGPDLFSAFTPNQKKPDKKPSFCTFKLCEKPPDVETLTVEESEGKPEKGKEKSYKRKTSKDDRSSEDSDGPDLFSAFTPNQKKPDKKPSFCTFKLCEKPPDVETLTVEESEGKPEKGKEKSYKRKTSKDDRSSEDSDGPDLFSAFTPNQKKPDKKPSFSSPVKKGDKQEILTGPVHETQLPVICGDKEGTLYRDKLLEGEKCILSRGHWFTPTAFEKFGGKEKCKNWKTSIRCRNIPLKKLIEVGHLECPQRKSTKKTCVQKQNMNERFPVSSNKSSSKDSETGFGFMEESDPEDVQEQRGKGGGTKFRGRVKEEEDMAGLSVFQAPSLPVTCVSLTGTLYKDRFALGSRGKCIRTEERWFTPEEFVKQEPTLTDGHWKKDILCFGKTLNFLLKKKILYIHSLLCECVKCSTLEQDVMAQNNDDECYVCRSVGDLVCCDECPRAFHSHCHLPAIPGETPGEWICTFCMLRKSQQWCDPNNMSEQEAFNSPVSQYILHCHCLLLCVYREDIQKVFVKDPRQMVSRYSEFITQPMWKLETGAYQTVGEFVSDFQLIFSNCSTFSKDSEFGRMDAKLKQMFEEEFRKIFKIAEVFTPEILKGNDKDKNKNVYRFVCPYAGQFLCSLTSLVFVMEGEGAVHYNTVSWDPRLLDGLSKTDKSAGPLYDIKCFNGSISRLHLPHCEIFSEEDMDCLAVAHFTNGNVAIMNPLKVTETHVMIDIKDLSIFGLIKRMIFRPSPVVAQVLVFLRPITMREEENILDVHLLPWNVPLSEVKDQHAENTHIKTSSKCCLTPGTQYHLCCQPEGSTVQPATEEFEFNFGPNYHPTFEVFVNVRNKEVKLSLMNSTEGREVWVPRRIILTGQDVDLPVHRQLVASEFVNKHRCPLIQRVSSVMMIADGLRAKGMIAPEMYDKIHDTKPRQNKMRALLKALDSGGASVKAEFYRLLKENEPHLVDELDSGPNRPQ